MIPLGCAGGCQMSLTDVVLTSGNRMPTGGPGTETIYQKGLKRTKNEPNRNI